MVSRKEDVVDFNKLEQEVTAAMEAEARYYRENDAKFRAINQRVATYEEFRDIVLASHLKPLDKEDRLDKIQWNQPWNQVAAKSNSSDATQVPTSELNKVYNKPANGHEFSRDWRRLCKTNADKYAFLLWLGADDIGKIFKGEISFGLLGDIVMAMDDQYQATHSHTIAAILKTLSTVNRFKLSLDFLSEMEKEACQRLFHKLLSDCETDGGTDSEQATSTESNRGSDRGNLVFTRQDILSLKEKYES